MPPHRGPSFDKDRALEALIASTSAEEAARKAGVAVSKLKQWMRDKEFRRQYRQRCQRYFGLAQAKAQRYMLMTVESLYQIVRCPLDKRAVNAARLLYDIARGSEDHMKLMREIELMKDLIHGRIPKDNEGDAESSALGL